MDSRKNRGMGKIFPCFRPDVVDHDDVNAPAFVHTNCKPPLESSLSSSSSFDDPDSSTDGSRSKSSTRRRFSRALKAVFFDTSLSMKIRERKSRKNSFRSSSSSDKSAKSINGKSSSFEESLEADEINRINSTHSSIFSLLTNGSSSLSSSCASSRNADSTALTEIRGSFGAESMDKRESFRAIKTVERKESFRGLKSMELQKQISAEKKMDQYYYSSTVGLCLLLVSLLVLVFWGRICAIFCTSVWLFLGPRRIKGQDQPENLAMARWVDVDSGEYKKRVIMEGLLERNRNRPAQ